ncbi:unnamed protein product [Cladocopium goreaui]|uniref:Peroxin-7 n=1 Tax=Cladocopium goreaui TaxID=2562237 RepID=A0A9P1C6U2_9DINO|nr:unnamed protein product [Cladocopium goreaui]
MGNATGAFEDSACCSGVVHWLRLPFTQGDLLVTGFPRRSNGSANGAYAIRGEHHGRPVFQRIGSKGPFIYFWDDRDGESWCGWWLGPILGGAEVWGYHPKEDMMPPEYGWRSPWHGEDSKVIRMSVSGRVSLLEVRPKKKEVVPKWIAEPGFGEALTEDAQLLQSCCICLEPLWNAEPSVFLTNLQRLCPHYFCSQCAKRIVVEQTSLGLQPFKEDMQIAFLDGLASVLDAKGGRLGDLVWTETARRLTDGELYLVFSQLELLVELEVGMEFRRCQDQALVLQKGVLFGCLLLLQGRSLRRVHPEELSIEGLDHAVVQPGTLIPLRRRFVVYKGGEIQFWRCQRCSFENSSSDFGCKLCGSPPSCPQDLPQEGRRLGLAGVAALRSRFAMRPQLHWAVQLKCPLCRIAAVALVVPVPLLDQAPKEWFDLVSQQKSTISQSDLAQGLSVILPLSVDRLGVEVQRRFGHLVWPLTFDDFLGEGGPAQWACRQLHALRSGRHAQVAEEV